MPHSRHIVESSRPGAGSATTRQQLAPWIDLPTYCTEDQDQAVRGTANAIVAVHQGV